MDILHNEYEGMKVRGLPTIIIISKNWKEPVYYESKFE